MSTEISITPDQIDSTAERLRSLYSDGNEYSRAEWCAAVEAWLRSIVRDVLDCPEWFVDKLSGHHLPGDFNIPVQCDDRNCTRRPLPDDIFCALHRQIEDAKAAQMEADFPAFPY